MFNVGKPSRVNELYYYDIGLLLREASDRLRVRLNMYLVYDSFRLIDSVHTGCIAVIQWRLSRALLCHGIYRKLTTPAANGNQFRSWKNLVTKHHYLFGTLMCRLGCSLSSNTIGV